MKRLNMQRDFAGFASTSDRELSDMLCLCDVDHVVEARSIEWKWQAKMPWHPFR